MNLTTKDLLAEIGALTLEAKYLRLELEAKEAKLKELEPPAEPDLKVVKGD